MMVASPMSDVWTDAMRTLLGYSAYAPDRTVAVCRGSSCKQPDPEEAPPTTGDRIRIVVECEADDAEVSAIAVQILRDGVLRLIPGCRLYAADHWANVEVLSADESWFVDPSDRLASKKLPMTQLRAKGERMAIDRLRRLVGKMKAQQIVGSPPKGSIGSPSRTPTFALCMAA